MDDASLLWDADVESGSSDDGLVAPKIWALSGGNRNVVAVASQEDLIFLDAETGEVFDKINALKAVNGNLRKGQSVQWLTVVGNGQSAKALFAYVNAKGEIQSGNDLYFAQLEVGNDQFKSIKSLNKGKHILANSVTLQAVGGEKWHVLAVTKSGVLVDTSVDDSNITEEVAASKLHPSWATVVAVEATSEPSVARIMGKTSPESEVTMALFRFDEAAGQGWERLYGSADAPEIELTVGVANSESANVKIDWTAEEGLSSLSSALFVDASHLGFDDLVEEKDTVSSKLSISGRLNSQWENTMKLMSAAGLLEVVGYRNRDHIFGFIKVAALLSPSSHKMWGMTTAGENRGSIRWSLDLPKSAMWHSMVHGTTNSAKAVNGINGNPHSREILVLPIYGSSTGGCRQAALLLLEDLTVVAVPSDAETALLAKKQLQKTPNGLYTHRVDKASSQVQSFQVFEAGESKLEARSIGSTSFTGERIVQVAYPSRHEEIQSMSTILGDNSLLLKYINPHLAVVVTVLNDDGHQSATEISRIVDKAVKPRKPAGAGTSEASPDTVEPLPNMFVNLIDIVSGRTLHRTSHTGVDVAKDVSVVVTENWVIYSFVNLKSRRTQIGVLTLHEGMIDSAGMTFFTHPEQATSFSSFDARESKPVVLAKTYTFPKQVTALGVTSTRQGISSQNILMASSDGGLDSFHKKLFETRRPVGEVKPDEKKEGLIPYHELIPESPILSLTYNRTMEPFTNLASSETLLESQSLIMGFGGPDLFFTRTSPTKGFDLLPETFNKLLVGAATVGIVVALMAVQHMGSKKALQQSWM
ncbi:MAG: hypothetical protein SGILL_006204 [Bacillariaceae sp.]